MAAVHWARMGFAIGYAEHGTFPISPRTLAACRAAQESAPDLPLPLIVEAITGVGRDEGKRARREVAHHRLYMIHKGAMTAAWNTILMRLNATALAPAILALAAQHDDAGTDAIARRRAVASAVAVIIARQIHTADRQNLDALNADGWSHADAYGTGEANATHRGGSLPDPVLVGAAAGLAYRELRQGRAETATQGWTDQQLNALAMKTALTAGDGTARDAGAVAETLTDSGAGLGAYADELHAAVTGAYLLQMNGLFPEATYNLVTTANACDVCLDLEVNNPYPANEVPDPPIHQNCQCNLELAQAGTDELADV